MDNRLEQRKFSHRKSSRTKTFAINYRLRMKKYIICIALFMVSLALGYFFGRHAIRRNEATDRQDCNNLASIIQQDATIDVLIYKETQDLKTLEDLLKRSEMRIAAVRGFRMTGNSEVMFQLESVLQALRNRLQSSQEETIKNTEKREIVLPE